MNRDNFLKQINHKQLMQAVFQSQLLFLFIAIFLSVFLFPSFSDWSKLFSYNIKEISYYGILPALLIIAINILLKKFIPKEHLDDGGINEKLFKNSTVWDIFKIAFIVAICEEVLFRGLIQTTFGLIFASLIFALVHFRYLKKPVLLISIVLISFYLGYLYLLTGNLLVTMVAHFFVDFILGLIIRFEK